MEVFSDEAFNVTDSTDWLNTPLACLMPVEQAFRCHVCKDFYDSPMLTSCNHTFCSLCIRRCLSVDSKCPLCRATDQESKLRGNWALREAVEAFTKARKAILEFAKAPPTVVAAPPDQNGSSSPPKRKATELGGAKEEEQETKRPRRSTRSTKTRAAQLTAAILEEEEDTSATPSADADQDYVDQPPDDGLVACPICLTRMKIQQVDRHIETSCPGSPEAAAALAAKRPTPQPTFPSLNSRLGQPTQPQKAPERLPALAYSMLRDTALRKKLSELGLSTHGSRQLLEKRHKEWITLWNANCDSSRPKKRSELLRDLDEWERTVGNPGASRVGMGMAMGGGMGVGQGPMARAQAAGAEIKDKEFDGKAWATRYGGSFGDLIKQARKGIKKQNLDGDEGNKKVEDGKEGGEKPSLPAELPDPQAGEGEGTGAGESNSVALTPMEIVPPSSPPQQEQDVQQTPGKAPLTEDTAIGGQVIPGTPEKGHDWKTSSQQPPIAGDA